MANTSIACTDKTGTLTQYVMSVVASSTDIHTRFLRNLGGGDGAHTGVLDQEQEPIRGQGVTDAGEPQVNRTYADFTIRQSDINTILSPRLNQLCCLRGINLEISELTFVGSKTETALPQFTKDLDWENRREIRKPAEVIPIIPFPSERKAIGIVVRLESGHHRLFLKDASEILTQKCTCRVVVSKSPNRSQNANSEGPIMGAFITLALML